MASPVTAGTKRYEIIFVVVTQKAAGLNMMHLECMHAATILATPAVALEDLPA